MTNGKFLSFFLSGCCCFFFKAGWGCEGLSSFQLINTRVIKLSDWAIQELKHTVTEQSLNMEPDTLSPRSFVYCVDLFITCVSGVKVRACLCVFLVTLCVLVWKCKSQLESIWTLSCLSPTSIFPMSPSVCLLSPCYFVIAELVGPFSHCVWVCLAKMCVVFCSREGAKRENQRGLVKPKLDS